HSLGKEEKQSRVEYLGRFLKYVLKLHDEYKTVFVHMNEEYVLIAGWWWKLSGKRVYLWRNHAKGSWKTRLAVFFSTKVFYTSPSSFTAQFKKAVQMPVGI